MIVITIEFMIVYVFVYFVCMIFLFLCVRSSALTDHIFDRFVNNVSRRYENRVVFW